MLKRPGRIVDSQIRTLQINLPADLVTWVVGIVVLATLFFFEVAMKIDESNSSNICFAINRCDLLPEDAEHLSGLVDRNREIFDDCDAVIYSLITGLADALRLSNERHTVFVNNLVSSAIHDHVLNRRWVQLRQIDRSLPDSIVQALGDGSVIGSQTIQSSCEASKAFDGLSLDNKRRALAHVSG